jgi:hypothetical protein
VEVRTEELATAAMQLDKVELCGRHINVGRPKGYVEPPAGSAPQVKMGQAQMFAAQLANAPTTVLLLQNMVKARSMLDDTERHEVRAVTAMRQCELLALGGKNPASLDEPSRSPFVDSWHGWLEALEYIGPTSCFCR